MVGLSSKGNEENRRFKKDLLQQMLDICFSLLNKITDGSFRLLVLVSFSFLDVSIYDVIWVTAGLAI